MKEQSFENHFRWNPLFHFIVAPLLAANLIFAIVRMVQDPNVDRAAYIVLSVVFVLMHLVSRLQILTVQDRVIRLEERVRFAQLLPSDLAKKASKLKTSQLIAIRFASDEELESLVRRVLDGEFDSPKEIKRAVKNWRADHIRA